MKNIKNYDWNLFELFLIGIVTVISIYFFIQATNPLFAFVDLIAAFCGICSVVLCAKGKKSGFIFGLINVIGYSIIAFNSSYYGEVLLNTVFFIPINIASYINWKHNQFEDKNEVIPKRLSVDQVVTGSSIVAATVLITHYIFLSFGEPMTLLDGTTTVLSIVASLLMWRRYAEQWFCWIIINIITVVMWIVAEDPIMITMWSAYLINAFYGYYLWIKKTQ